MKITCEKPSERQIGGWSWRILFSAATQIHENDSLFRLNRILAPTDFSGMLEEAVANTRQLFGRSFKLRSFCYMWLRSLMQTRRFR